MPKFKTHRASAKRFKKTASGALKRGHAYTSHRFHPLRYEADPPDAQPDEIIIYRI